MYICKFCPENICPGTDTELKDPEVVLMMNFIKIDYQNLVTS